MREKVVVLMGGSSAERSISLLSGRAVLDSLQQAGFDAHALDPQTKILDTSLLRQYQKAFVMLHGYGGEDGSIQGLLDSIDLPYTGSGVLASSLTFDKWRTSLLWKALNLPVVPNYLVSANVAINDNLLDAIKSFGMPLIVKPTHQGSSVGITKVDDWNMLKAAIQLALNYGKSALIEPWLSGAEYTVAILHDKALPSIKIESSANFYDYDAKYLAGKTRYFCPSGLTTLQENWITSTALSAYRACGCRGWGRVDFKMDQDEKFYLLELNTIPGMTQHSLFPMAAQQAGYNFSQSVINILSLATTDAAYQEQSNVA